MFEDSHVRPSPTRRLIFKTHRLSDGIQHRALSYYQNKNNENNLFI